MEDVIPNLPMTFDRPVQNGQMMEFQDRALARFEMMPEIQKHASQEAGRPIYTEVPYVRIVQPGERDELVRRATDRDKMRFARAWTAFERNQQGQTMEGTPLSVLFPHNPGVVKTLDFLNVRTVEQLASLGDTQLQNIGLGAREWQDAAKRFLASAERGQGFQEIEAQIDAKDNQIAKLTDVVSKLEAQVAEMQNGKSGRSRGKNQETE